MPGHRLEHPVPSDPQHGRLIPRGVGHEVMHRLMACADMPRIDACRHRLNALALPGQAQPGEIGAGRLPSVGVPEHLRQPRHVLPKPLDPGVCDSGHVLTLAWYPPESLTFLTQ